LVRAFGPGFPDDLFCLEDPLRACPLRQPTTARLEAARALRALGPRARAAVPALQAVALGDGPAEAALGPELRGEAIRALSAITGDASSGVAPCPCSEVGRHAQPCVSPWLGPDQRADPDVAGLEVTDQTGRPLRLGDLRGRPALLSFFYSRCENPQKCSRTVSSYARLQQQLRRGGLESEIRLVLFTYDPAYDDARRLTNYAEARGLDLGVNARMLRPAVADLQQLCERLRVNVSFNAGAVSVHGVQAVLLDRQGRFVRVYHSTHWEDEQVLADVRELLREPVPGGDRSGAPDPP
jgi:protein SCO1/2